MLWRLPGTKKVLVKILFIWKLCGTAAPKLAKDFISKGISNNLGYNYIDLPSEDKISKLYESGMI